MEWWQVKNTLLMKCIKILIYMMKTASGRWSLVSIQFLNIGNRDVLRSSLSKWFQIQRSKEDEVWYWLVKKAWFTTMQSLVLKMKVFQNLNMLVCYGMRCIWFFNEVFINSNCILKSSWLNIEPIDCIFIHFLKS